MFYVFFCVVLCILLCCSMYCLIVLFYVLFILYCSMYCLCVNVYCHRVTTQLQLTNKININLLLLLSPILRLGLPIVLFPNPVCTPGVPHTCYMPRLSSALIWSPEYFVRSADHEAFQWEFYSIPLQVQWLQDLVMISEELNYYAKIFLKAIQINHVSAILRQRCELLFFFLFRGPFWSGSSTKDTADFWEGLNAESSV